MKKSKITVLKGDGIGPEVVDATMDVLKALSDQGLHDFEYQEELIGGAAIDAVGDPLPASTVDACLSSDAVLLGAVGGPKWDHLPGNERPEKGLLRIRQALGLYANLRPAVLYSALEDACPIRESFRPNGIDIMVVRELTGGIYFGDHITETLGGETVAYDIERYSEKEIERIAKTAFEIAMKRNKKVVSVDKANVLDSSRLWRKTVERIAVDYPEVELSHMFVDNASMQLVRAPGEFDVLLTSNMFGDILSDEASMVTGSIGILPSASLSSGKLGMYEPIHGSAPDIAGQDIADPIATILSAALMLRYSLDDEISAKKIEAAVDQVLQEGWRTKDIAGNAPADKVISTHEMGQKISSLIGK